MKKKRPSRWTLKILGTYQKDGKTYKLYGFDPPATGRQIDRHLFWMEIINYLRFLGGLEELPDFPVEGVDTK